MSIKDDLVEQERWERMPSYYKRNTPPPCPELVSEQTKLEMMTTKDWVEKVESLEKEIKIQDAMIDWLTYMIVEEGNGCGCTFTPYGWKEAARELVEKEYGIDNHSAD